MAQHPAHSQDHRHAGQPSPAEVQNALGGIDYPTSREKMVRAAPQHGASQEIVELIGRLPERNYDSPAAVYREVTRIE
jgi:hypothetical protein